MLLNADPDYDKDKAKALDKNATKIRNAYEAAQKEFYRLNPDHESKTEYDANIKNREEKKLREEQATAARLKELRKKREKEEETEARELREQQLRKQAERKEREAEAREKKRKQAGLF